MDGLRSFLNDRRITENSKNEITHTMMETPRGKYSIKLEDEHTLFSLLEKVQEPLSLLEVQTSTCMPVLIDVDLKSEEKKNLYQREQVQTVVSALQKVLHASLENVDKAQLTCYLLEKTSPYFCEKAKIWKHGFHLHCPYLFLTRFQLEKNIIPDLLGDLRRIYSENPNYLPCAPDFLIDPCIYRGKGKSWFILGCGKAKMPYQVTMKYNFLQQGVSIKQHRPTAALMKAFSIHLSADKKRYIGKMDPRRGSFETLVPVVPSKQETNIPVQKYEQEGDVERDAWVDEILELLDKSFSIERDKWMYVGWILYNLYEGTDAGFQRWNLFSKKCPEKYQERVCCEEWQRMQKKNMTLGSLKHLAKESNPEEYQALVKSFARRYTSKCKESSMTHYDIAKMLFQMFEGCFVCANVGKNVWYQFEGGIWKQSDDGVHLRNQISTTIVEQIEEIRELVHEEARKNMGEGTKFKADDTEKLKSIQMLLKQLKTTPFKKNVMLEARDLFFDATFLDKLDSNENLFSFRNGVLSISFNKETQKNEYTFEKPAPEHYMSLRSPVSYNPDLTADHPKVKAVIDFFEKIFPNERIRRYFLELNSYIFRGGNTQKKVQVWSGVGDNGKSVTEKLFEKLLGPYCVKLPTSLITGQRSQSGAACPELARAGCGQRFAFLQETSKKESMNVGILKELSGNDTFYARNLFKEGKEMTPQFKLVLVCNEPPRVDGAQTDQATWNRIRVIPFESKFVEDAPDSFAEQMKQKRFPIDRQFDEKIPDLLEGLVFLLLHEFSQVSKHIYEPEEVTVATQSYKNKNDFYGIFVSERIRLDAEETVTMNDLFISFKDWFKDSNENSTMPSKQDVKDYFVRAWGSPENGILWRGRGLMMEENDEEF